MTDSNHHDKSNDGAILEFDEVTFHGDTETSLGMQNFCGDIRPGDFVQVQMRQHHDPRDLVSTMLGLYFPSTGTVRYRGQDWLGTDHQRHFKMRTQIGRVFAGSAWINNLSVLENVMLSMCHHGLPESEVFQKVQTWLKRLAGPQTQVISDAMGQLPAVVEPSILQVCQWVRAVCNHPKLLILERPLHYVIGAVQEEIIAIIEELRSAGTAFLVFSGADREIEYGMVNSVTHWSIVGNTVTRRSEDAPQ